MEKVTGTSVYASRAMCGYDIGDQYRRIFLCGMCRLYVVHKLLANIEYLQGLYSVIRPELLYAVLIFI